MNPNVNTLSAWRERQLNERNTQKNSNYHQEMGEHKTNKMGVGQTVKSARQDYRNFHPKH